MEEPGTPAGAPPAAAEVETAEPLGAAAGASSPEAGPAAPDAETGEAAPTRRRRRATPELPPAAARGMELSVRLQALKAGLAAVVAGLPARASLPVLTNVLLATDGDGRLRLSATDLDTTVARTVPASVTGAGAVLVPGKKLQEIAREIPDGCTLDMRLEGSTLHLRCAETRTRYRLATVPADEFPSAPTVPWEVDAFSVPAGTLSLLVERTSFAASTEETRPILNGVLWEIGPEELAMVATDGHRLSVARVEGGVDAPAGEVIVHPRALALAARLAHEGEEVRVARGERHVGFRGDGWELVARTIEGPYADDRRVIPEDDDRSMVADRAALTAALRRMAILATNDTHRVRLALGGPEMRLSVECADVGAAHEDVAVDYEGDPLEIGFNAQYLLELLRFLPAGDVRMTFRAPERAATLRPVDEAGGVSTEMIIMPLRLLG